MECMQAIRESVDQLKLLVDDIVWLSTIEASSRERYDTLLVKHPFDMLKTIDGVFMRFQSNANSKKLQLKLDIVAAVSEGTRLDDGC